MLENMVVIFIFHCFYTPLFLDQKGQSSAVEKQPQKIV